MAEGRFVTLEGGEGAGKSTQAAMLVDALRRVGIDAVLTREPGGAPGAEAIRHLLVEESAPDWSVMSEALLHYAARREHLDRTILPELARGLWVVCDRFADSTMAYQGYGHGLGRDVIERLHGIVVGPTTPDLTIILDLNPEAGLARALNGSATPSRYERLDAAFHRRVMAAFVEIAERHRERCVMVDAAGDRDHVAAQIRAIVSDRFGVALR